MGLDELLGLASESVDLSDNTDDLVVASHAVGYIRDVKAMFRPGENQLLTEDKAIDMARLALKAEGFKFIEAPIYAEYRHSKLSVGVEKKGWVISFELDVPATMEPNIVFVHVSDPDKKIYIPPVL